jgi:hypothetical protein
MKRGYSAGRPDGRGGESCEGLELVELDQLEVLRRVCKDAIADENHQARAAFHPSFFEQ